MDRKERTIILEPFMLILKQRTGIASVIAVVLAIFLYSNEFSLEAIAMTIAPIFMYIGKQTYLDSKETSSNLTKEVVDVLEVLGVLKDKEEITKTETNINIEEVTDLGLVVKDEQKG